MKIYKKEIAKEQINLAIKLFFENKNNLALHTLIMSSKKMLEELVKKQGGKIVIDFKDKEISEKNFIKISHKIYNYSKHSDRDKKEYVEIENFDEIRKRNIDAILYSIMLYLNLYNIREINIQIFFDYLIVEGLDKTMGLILPKEEIESALSKHSNNLKKVKSYFYKIIIKNES